MQSHKGVKITRYDLKTTFDEANYIIPHQVVTAFQEGKRAIKIISADKTVEKNTSIVSFLLSTHGLSGCSEVPMMLGIGKGKLIKVLQKFPLTYLGNITPEKQEYMKKGKLLVARCYGMTYSSSTENR